MKLIALVIFLIGTAANSLQGADIGNAPVLNEKNLRAFNEIKIRVGLDGEQSEQAIQLFKASESQEKIDAELFKTSSLALIRAAERRRDMTDRGIEAMLKPDQEDLFRKFLEDRKKNEELFRLQEGLLLSPLQTNRVELVINDYRERLRILYLKLDYYVRSGEDRKKKTSESSRLLSGRSKGLEGRNPEVRKMEQGPPGLIRDLNSEKAGEIRKILSDAQIPMYDDYLKFQDQELDLYIKNLKK